MDRAQVQAAAGKGDGKAAFEAQPETIAGYGQ